MTPHPRPDGFDEVAPDDAAVDAEPDDRSDEGGPVEVDMRFTVIGRADGRVHLVSEGGGVLFAHPAVSDEVWHAALDEVPDSWEIVDLPEPVADVVPAPDADGPGADELAARQFSLLASFLRAGFDRSEAMALVLELLRSEPPDW